ncbi:MAG TPA: isoprenylcysteine carboxylmethyltransferase family protein [Candidatus Dormibacteraeota bacterium]|nr:isoprenylcysteine carboxylmethyltransferase family protein [Candidatus Dormibacteraeota bacterium]
MIAALALVAFVAVQRGVELFYARRNTRRLLAAGGVEAGAEHYPLFILLHASWLIALLAYLPRSVEPNGWLVAVFFALQGLRVWAIRSLGPFWTTRLITVPGAPLVRRGPYRFIRHPNYVVVAGEIAVLPLALGEPWVALGFSLLNAGLLAVRIRKEDDTLSERQSTEHA